MLFDYRFQYSAANPRLSLSCDLMLFDYRFQLRGAFGVEVSVVI